MIERLKRGYEVLAFALLGFLVLLVLLNAAAWLVLALWDGLRPPRPSAARQAVYPGLSDDEIRRLLEETWDGAWRYEPWVGFREEPRSGRFVNISPEGFRFNAERDRRLGEPGLAVYVFGGSTTFGYGVADGETIPSYLEEELRGRAPGEDVRVYNFGRGWYYSTQELVLLEQLLREGHVPDVAVFLDGLNEGQPGPYYSREMAALFEAYNDSGPALTGLAVYRGSRRSPLLRLATRGLARFDVDPWPRAEDAPAREPGNVRGEVELMRRSVLALGEELGFRPYFFLQPTPGHRNRFFEHAFAPPGSVPDWPGRVDPKMLALESLADGTASFNLTDLLEGYEGQPFVDLAHYTPDVCRRIARAMGREIRRPGEGARR